MRQARQNGSSDRGPRQSSLSQIRSVGKVSRLSQPLRQARESGDRSLAVRQMRGAIFRSPAVVGITDQVGRSSKPIVAALRQAGEKDGMKEAGGWRRRTEIGMRVGQTDRNRYAGGTAG